MKNIIEVKELKKSYGANSVLKGINLTVHKGEIFALLGVNGAGKTTALECIEGLLAYDSGNITVNGKIGIQLQSSAFLFVISICISDNIFPHLSRRLT